MKRFSCFILLILVILVGTACTSIKQPDISVSTVGASNAKGSGGFNPITLENQYDKLEEIYTQDFQNQIHNEIKELTEDNEYTLDTPLLISNPYGTITNGLYIYFETKEKTQVKYTVSVDGYGDFERMLKEGSADNYNTIHANTIIGLIPDTMNRITLSVIDQNGDIVNSVSFDYRAPSLIGNYDTVQSMIEKGDSTKGLSEGLYTILGNDTASKDKGNQFIAMYDNAGIIRCEIPILSYRANQILFDQDRIYFSIDHTHIVGMENTGYVSKLYSTGQYELHHDYMFGRNNDLLVLGKDPESDTTEDLVLDIDLDTGKVNKLIDFRDYFGNYYTMTSLPEGESQIDWMHINSLTFTEDDKLLISSRETSTIVAFENIYSADCRVVYILGSDHFWKDTGYENLLYNPEGDFSLHSGQHQITYLKDNSLKKGQYYLLLFNNNNTYSETRPGYDWLSDENYSNTGVGSGTEAVNSYYYKYLIDENTRSYSLVNSIPTPYSAYVSGIQPLDNGNLLIDSGSALTAYEYDANNQLLQSITVNGKKWTYRIMKYDYKGFWFQ